MTQFRKMTLVVLVTTALLALSAPPAAAIPSEDHGKSSNGSQKPGSSNAVCDGDSGANSDAGHGANQKGPNAVDGRGPYDSSCPGDPSDTGNGDGVATGIPDEGSVGQADDKNPGAASGAGQMPSGLDSNKGYECDDQKGIGDGNPAHTGCASPPTLLSSAGAAAITDLPCGDSTTTISLSNYNSAAAGKRVFVIKLDSVTAATEILAAGESKSVELSITDDNTSHLVTVESGSAVLASKGLKVTSCSTTVRVLGAQFLRGPVLPVTGTNTSAFALAALLFITAGLAIEVARRIAARHPGTLEAPESTALVSYSTRSSISHA